VGIGGAGVSALAKLFVAKGYAVEGSDLKRSTNVKTLEKLKIPIAIGAHKASNLSAKTSLLIYTNDANTNNPEISKARRLKIPVMSYPQALAWFLRDYKTIAISGTHGKTTTTAMLAEILVKAGFDPTVVVGSSVASLAGNARLGRGIYAVIEADEYKKAFLNYSPHIAVVTNIEADHLNYYKNLKNIERAFRDFIEKVPRGGLVLANADDPGARAAAGVRDCCVAWYGLGSQNDLFANKINLRGPFTTFNVEFHDRNLGQFKLRVPGLHNVKNSLAAIGVASHLGVPLKQIKKALGEFKGTKRRFEFKGEAKTITVIDDFAHHPTELTATLQAARERFGKRRLVVIFQPHFYGRLKDFFGEFVKALNLANMVVVPPVFYVAGRENVAKISKSFNSKTLAAAVNKAGTRALAAPDMRAALALTMASIKSGDVVMTIGAGNVTELGAKILKQIAK